MKHQNITLDNGKKPFVKPQINVVEIMGADIICSSTGSTEDYGNGDTSGWY